MRHDRYRGRRVGPGLVRQWVNRVGSALLAVAFVAGPPLAVLGWLWHRHWMLPTEWRRQEWFTQPSSPAVVLALVAMLAVSGWLCLAALIVRRTVDTAQEWWRRMRRLPLPTPAQMTAGSMAGVAVLAMPTIVAQPAAGPPPAGATEPHLTDVPRQGGTAAVRTDAEQTGKRDGIALPGGGWIPYRTALAVSAVSGLVWLHRRRHYRPRPDQIGRHDTDPDLHELPDTANTVVAAITPEDGSPLPAPPDLAALDELPAGRLALHGPAAEDAARGLLVTAVLADSADDRVRCRSHRVARHLGPAGRCRSRTDARPAVRRHR